MATGLDRRCCYYYYYLTQDVSPVISKITKRAATRSDH